MTWTKAEVGRSKVSKSLPEVPALSDLTPSQRRAVERLGRIYDTHTIELKALRRRVFVKLNISDRSHWADTSHLYIVGVTGKTEKL